MTTQYTKNFRLNLPDFRMGPWNDLINSNTVTIDELLLSAYQGVDTIPWENNHVYNPGTTTIDLADDTFWICSTAHTSAVLPTTFAEDRAANPTYWNRVVVGISPRGQWDNDTHYLINDMVTDQVEGVIAICIQEHTSSPIPATIRDDIINWTFLADLEAAVGPPGPQGDKGDKGDKGDTGNVGPVGPQGAKGDKGDTGADSTVVGPKGDKGDKGDQGNAGPVGAASTVPGPQGPQGPQGNVGPQGPQGNVGPQGPVGPGVASTVAFTPTGNVASTDVQAAIAEVDTEKVAKAGDTMTGDLIIDKISPLIKLNKKLSGQQARIDTTMNDLLRWSFTFSSGGAESGGNAGSDWNLKRYDDAGVVLGTPLLITRSTGLVTLSGDPTAALGAATKQYVDGKAIPPGTIMLFWQATAPGGWTQVVTQNDKALRVVSGAGGGAGGLNSFSSVFGQSATGAHTLTTPEIASHSHVDGGYGVLMRGATTDPPGWTFNGVPGGGDHPVNSTGGDGSHTHPLTMSISYLDIILASKN